MKSVKNIILDALKNFRIQLLKDNYSTTITNGNRYALSQAGAKAMYDDLNSRKYYLMDRAGTVIPDNSDLNSYTTPGRYYCLDSASAATLSNCPYQAGFNLYVETVGYNWIHQTLRVCSNHIAYERVYDQSNWSGWRLITLVHGGDIHGPLRYIVEGVDTSKADNNVTAQQWPTLSSICDSQDRVMARQEAVVYPNGNIGSYWYVRNYNTSGTMVAQKGIQMVMNKSGVLAYYLDEPSKFLAAIGVVFERRSATFSSIAANSGLEITMNLAKSGYKGVPCYAFTVTRVIVANIYNQDSANNGKVYLINTSGSAVSGTVYVNMIYLSTS